MENLGKVTAVVSLVLVSLLASFLEAYVCVDLLGLYETGIVIGVAQMFMLIALFGLIISKTKEKKSPEPKRKIKFTEAITKAFEGIIERVLTDLFMWGLLVAAWYLVFKS